MRADIAVEGTVAYVDGDNHRPREQQSSNACFVAFHSRITPIITELSARAHEMAVTASMTL